MLRIDESLLIDALKKEKPMMPANWAARYAPKMIARIDSRLEQNVLEWMQSQPLTDISFEVSNGERFSIASVMAYEPGFSFLDAMEIMNLFFTDEKAARGMMNRVYM